MASIFNALHIGYSALNAAQIAIDTTGHNISNAETEGYSRQRVVTAAAYPISIDPGQRGNGTQITEITRVFDKFVFNRYTTSAQNKEYSDSLKKNLEELSTYFPEIDDVGIKNDMQNYFDMWQSLANNPSNSSLKVALAQQAQTLSQHITETRSQIAGLQSSLNEQVKVNIDEVNRIAEQIAGLNKSINEEEAGGLNNANDLRDQRNKLEMTLSKLIGSKVLVGQIESRNDIDSNIAIEDGSYTIQVGGFNLVDGHSFHPIGVDNLGNQNGYNDLYYERQDGVKIPFASNITGGKVGALLELRGSIIGDNGEFEDGFLQETLNNLDTFARGMIESTNNLYAQSATSSMRTNTLSFSSTDALMNTDENFNTGTFDVVVYDIDGNEVGRRSITINDTTVMEDSPLTANSIIGQMRASVDDNSDNNALNDIDDILTPGFASNVFQINLNSSYASQGYTFAIEDQGTNFAGVTGVNRFFDGYDAKTMDLNTNLKNDPTLIKGHKSPAEGDNQTALDMVELQFSSIMFKNGTDTSSDTVYGYFDSLVTKIGTKTNSAILSNESITAQYNAVKQEYDSVSKVSIDEELANLIRYQTSYGAAAKIITTIDQMMTTLLGIKQ
ncbi:flagellar hook-associated protein FlgK [Sulfuricurvum sp. RIFCSPLOWO2_12_FULL_43_24]|uniref:flagellar hook-associated protein FlgK n=1 Tax=Sulfuricurvum sp. RIFCSPLOWO2_12_FULL_43_24 TaxID=1802247 RepID=UPI0008AB887B|nr:flagellar hook-associated protein FlgK [Sulfuricurvum sp. RIFCSPLOWO2_12_FULL_43_24]OHD83864.1 MAG: flagellar hook-associated protein FlgK [Sulfuricurvum sp. RIFCSPHIGHO2_02_FULL_43_9]OHD86641.1 MAG: flagellar hook-associated protein FlgK [Sulfuricurvum sp. RIFCSPLOWO2_02_FULL_43_45]OHD90510.1 MAG: flagellar hook-associated protein FlgK [Sulfuricurvum sp. RIFCSPLOWO2_12_FULL_43_24]